MKSKIVLICSEDPCVFWAYRCVANNRTFIGIAIDNPADGYAVYHENAGKTRYFVSMAKLKRVLDTEERARQPWREAVANA